MSSLDREELERLYVACYVPRKREELESELQRRLRAERTFIGAPFAPGEYDDDPVVFVRGPSSSIDFSRPEYVMIFDERAARLERLRSDPRLLPPLRAHYAQYPVDFICDWGLTFDPRNPEIGLPATVPFMLFQRQREWIDYVLRKWRARERGLTEKSRESGVSWLAMSLGCTLALHLDGFVAGYGSRKEEYVDKLGDPKSLFVKARMFLEGLPPELNNGWDARKHGAHMRITFPGSTSMLTGEAGDNIGRGNRTSIYFVDEAAFLEHPVLAESALSNTTNCRIDISTPNGLGNPFEQNRHAGRIEIFTFHWRDDPRKDQAWYDKQRREAFSPAIVAQEIDIDYAASVEGVLIPHAWVLAAFDAHEKLGIEPSGEWSGALDVADEGMDLLAFAVRHGVVIDWVEEWAGRGADIYDSVERAFRIADHFELPGFRYDSDGLGAGVRGDARKVNEHRSALGLAQKHATPWRGSEAVWLPEGHDVPGRKNKDFFKNKKAQAWWSLRERFRKTFLWLTPDDEGNVVSCSPDDIISLSRTIDAETQPKMRLKIAAELSQPTFSLDNAGKIVIDKAPEGTRSPNLGDAIMMVLARGAGELRVTKAAVTRATMQAAGPHAMDSTKQRPPVVSSGLHINASMLQRARTQGAWTNRGI